jgi:hypothetical protein
VKTTSQRADADRKIARSAKAVTEPDSEPVMILFPEGVLLALCLADSSNAEPSIRDRMVRFQIAVRAAVHERRRFGDLRRFGEIAVEVCSVPLVERAMHDARVSGMGMREALCRILDEHLAHLRSVRPMRR